MKTNNFLSAVLLLFVVSTVSINAQRDDEGITKSFKVNKGGKLDVSINPGAIYFYPNDKNEVIVKVKNLKEKSTDDVEIYQEGNSVFVKYDADWGWGSEVEVSINLPSQFNVEAETSGGDIFLRGNLIGNVELSTMGGDISTKDVKGKVKISTQGGDLSVGNIEGGLQLSTMGGDIKIGEVSGEVSQVNTMGGDITVVKALSGIDAVTYGGDIEIKIVGGNSQLKTMGGSIEVGSVNGSVRMQTSGGNLLVNNASGHVDASTSAGDIVLNNITGSVNAKSSAGDVVVYINPAAGSTSNLLTNNGSIEINLLPSAKAFIEAEMKVRGNWKRMKDDFKIKSEFEAKSYVSDDNERKIKATYIINGGSGKIIASGNNSEITIKKSTK